MRPLAPLLLVGFGLTTMAAEAQSPASAQSLAERLQAHYATVRDFTAQFTHSFQSAVLPQVQTERGDVRIKKPDRMYWNYREPARDRKVFVADGVEIYSYVEADRAGIVCRIPQGDGVSTAVLFLAGRGNLVRDFAPSVPAEQPEGEWRLTLTPKTPQRDFSTLTLVVDRRTLALRGFETVDSQGAVSTFTFTNLKENVGLSDTTFNFSFPRGADVQRLDGC
jgi:outer membrane lipoprotein carrier protein